MLLKEELYKYLDNKCIINLLTFLQKAPKLELINNIPEISILAKKLITTMDKSLSKNIEEVNYYFSAARIYYRYEVRNKVLIKRLN